jgi:protein-tyrosine phosphatase
MRRYNFKNVFNCRDIGGYFTENHRVVKNHVFLRADNLTGLLESEIEFLKKEGLEAIIDLRHQNEIDLEPDPFVNREDVHYHNIAILDHAQFTLEDLNQIKLSDLYIQIAENANFIKQVFETLASYKGAVLYHCSAGKDRTGVITALLFKLVGVANVDIVTNYEVSFTYLVPKYVDADRNVSEVYADLFASKPETMVTFLQYLDTKYPNIRDYFLSKDISMETLDTIKHKMLD